MLHSILPYSQMIVAMTRVKWDGKTTGSRLTAAVAKVHDELKVPLFCAKVEVVVVVVVIVG